MAPRHIAAVCALVLVVGAGCEQADNGSSDVTETAPLVATPAQQEGPFYPVEKPSDRDNDLTVVAGAAARPAGSILLLEGRLLTTDGAPIGGATIEIWQTDAGGIYLHPEDPGVAQRDVNFQGYGETTTAADGTWEFLTIDPGYYEPRPRHIHLKIVRDGAVQLTSQIYFSDDPQAADENPLLVATITPAPAGAAAELLGEHTLVVDG